MLRTFGRGLTSCLVVACLGLGLLRAGQVRLVDLERMTAHAARIFSGECTSSQVEFDAALGRDVTVASFRVQRAVKGVTGRTVTVRMLPEAIGTAPGEPARSATDTATDGAATTPAFQPGDRVVLFLYGESSLGLSAPVGLGQGRFRIVPDKHGRGRAINGFGNRNLISGLRPEARTRLRLEARPLTGAAAGARPEQVEMDLDPDTLLDAAEALARGGR